MTYWEVGISIAPTCSPGSGDRSRVVLALCEPPPSRTNIHRVLPGERNNDMIDHPGCFYTSCVLEPLSEQNVL